jgi:adenine-specific DNA-methyltransferase
MPSLQFKGKVFVQNHHPAVPFHELLPVKSRGLSKKASRHDNLIIEGDNLAALKALLPTYHGKVKCVYIDPPHNTGNEAWAYNDNVNSPMMQEWLGKVVDREDLTRHDKWCCMMMPRLKLLRELLRDDGAIFVSIDDNEVHRLRSLMDEVFGEENFVATIIWEKFTRQRAARSTFPKITITSSCTRATKRIGNSVCYRELKKRTRAIQIRITTRAVRGNRATYQRAIHIAKANMRSSVLADV